MRSKRGAPINGWVNLNKPLGITSADAVNKVKHLLKPQKIGHAGTLDPLATGVLPLALGEGTKCVNLLMDAKKTYEFAVTFGESRTTDDAEGEVAATSDHIPTIEQIQAVLPQFTGEILQLPPIFSALKVAGRRAYDMARAGEEVVLQPRPITIYALELLGFTDALNKELDEVSRLLVGLKHGLKVAAKEAERAERDALKAAKEAAAAERPARREYADRGDRPRPAYKPREGGDERPARREYKSRDGGDAPRPYRARSEGAESKPYERKTYDKPRSDAGEGAPRTYRPRTEKSEAYGEKKPYGDRKPYGDKKAYGDKKPFGDKKPYGDRKPAGGKPFRKPRD